MVCLKHFILNWNWTFKQWIKDDIVQVINQCSASIFIMCRMYHCAKNEVFHEGFLQLMWPNENAIWSHLLKKSPVKNFNFLYSVRHSYSYDNNFLQNAKVRLFPKKFALLWKLELTFTKRHQVILMMKSSTSKNIQLANQFICPIEKLLNIFEFINAMVIIFEFIKHFTPICSLINSCDWIFEL